MNTTHRSSHTLDPELVAYSRYCGECEAENLDPHTVAGWRLHGRPTGPIAGAFDGDRPEYHGEHVVRECSHGVTTVDLVAGEEHTVCLECDEVIDFI